MDAPLMDNSAHAATTTPDAAPALPTVVEVLERDFDNMAGFEWGYAIRVRRLRRGGFSVGVRHWSNEGPTEPASARYPLRTGAQVWEAITRFVGGAEPYHSWQDAIDEATVARVVAAIAQLDVRLAGEVREAAALARRARTSR